MSDYDEYSGDEYGGEWLYVEDHYDEADNLAEHTCPSPVYEVNVDEDIGEYDPYDYWEDLTYLSDSYHDADPRPRRHNPRPSKPSAHATATKLKSTQKRVSKGVKPKLKPATSKSFRHTPVVWISSNERDAIGQPEKIRLKEVRGERIGLLKDWRERFKDAPGFHSSSRDEDSKAVEISGDGFDLNPASVAQLLASEEAIEQIKNMLQRQGLDPDALEVVMKDLIAGRDPSDANYDDEGEQAAEKRSLDAPVDETALTEGIVPEARPISNESSARTQVSIPHLAESRSGSETAQETASDNRRAERGNAISPSKSSRPRVSSKQGLNRPGKRSRLRSPSPVDEPISKRSRKQKVNYKGME